jgi:hypothetical protein
VLQSIIRSMLDALTLPADMTVLDGSKQRTSILVRSADGKLLLFVAGHSP